MALLDVTIVVDISTRTAELTIAYLNICDHYLAAVIK